MVFCCCNCSEVAKLKYICIHDFAFTGLTILGIIIQLVARNPIGVIAMLLHLICANAPRVIFGILLMKNNYSKLWANRSYWTRIITLVIQVILDIILIIGSIVNSKNGDSGGQGSIAGTIILIIIIIIVVSFDAYFAKAIKNYLNKSRNISPKNYNMDNSSHGIVMQNLPQAPSHITYIPENIINQSYTPYQRDLKTGVPTKDGGKKPLQYPSPSILPQLGKNRDMNISMNNLIK